MTEAAVSFAGNLTEDVKIRYAAPSTTWRSATATAITDDGTSR